MSPANTALPNLALPPRSSAADGLAHALRAGRVYRREDLLHLSGAIDRHLGELLAAGTLTRLAQGLYYAPKKSAFGTLPPDDHTLVGAFLRDQHFLLFSPSSFNALGLGTTQLYNKTLVYNHKRHGIFTFGKRDFDFRVKPRFPKALTPEFLLVDALNNLDQLAEDPQQVLLMAQRKLPEFSPVRLKRALADYGSAATKKRMAGWQSA